MKIHILYNLVDSAWGGGNQFLKALKEQFVIGNNYTDDIQEADIVLWNSHQKILEMGKLKRQGAPVVGIHRVDGPVGQYRGTCSHLDKLIYLANQYCADGTVFQSLWSREENYKQGMEQPENSTVIINASDPKIFNTDKRIKFSKDRKIRLIATSWSSNWKKGFKVYEYLDNNLDFSKYEMTFIGNSPVTFKNIKQIDPLPSQKLAEQLKQHDIFIAASEKDPCSNSLVEALSCGLPAVVLKDGGHPEILQEAGECFTSKTDIIQKLEQVVAEYNNYQQAIKLKTVTEVAREYYEFVEAVYDKRKTDPKKLSWFYKQYLFILWLRLKLRI